MRHDPLAEHPGRHHRNIEDDTVAPGAVKATRAGGAPPSDRSFSGQWRALATGTRAGKHYASPLEARATLQQANGVVRHSKSAPDHGIYATFNSAKCCQRSETLDF
ncbi:hypothetical protein GCM10023174_13970 [Chelativorans composti]